MKHDRKAPTSNKFVHQISRPLSVTIHSRHFCLSQIKCLRQVFVVIKVTAYLSRLEIGWPSLSSALICSKSSRTLFMTEPVTCSALQHNFNFTKIPRKNHQCSSSPRLNSLVLVDKSFDFRAKRADFRYLVVEREVTVNQVVILRALQWHMLSQL